MEIRPLAQEECHGLPAAHLLLLSHHTLDDLVALLSFADALTVDFVLLKVFTGRLPFRVRSWVVVCLFDLPDLLDVVLHLLEALVSFEERVELISVVNVAVTLPFDVEALWSVTLALFPITYQVGLRVVGLVVLVLLVATVRQDEVDFICIAIFYTR